MNSESSTNQPMTLRITNKPTNDIKNRQQTNQWHQKWLKTKPMMLTLANRPTNDIKNGYHTNQSLQNG